jgi:hypothetical protein
VVVNSPPIGVVPFPPATVTFPFPFEESTGGAGVVPLPVSVELSAARGNRAAFFASFLLPQLLSLANVVGVGVMGVVVERIVDWKFA